MSESERLARGTAPRPTDEGWRARRRQRRLARKRRVAAMPRGRRIARRLGILGTWLLGLLAVLVSTAVVLFYTLSDVPSPESVALPQVATIQYADGSVMARIGTVDHTLVHLSQVPKPVQWDVIAAEDRGFYSEPGVSIKGTMRAALSDLTGGDTQGGSGITQQYVKNAYLSNARTLTRKLKELAIAVKLSRQYSKDQILEYYLNTVYFGRGAYGIQAAAQQYFGTSVSKLDVAQGAVLAALLRAPSYYDPAVNPGEARARWQYVVDGMVSTGHLTQAQADRLAYPHVKDPPKNDGLSVSGPKALIVHRVIAELQSDGISEEEIYARGMVIRTTIDPRAQADAESAVRQEFAHLTRAQRDMKNALVAVDPSDGGVLAYYGGPDGTDYAGKPDYYDYAGLGSAAPGSSFKPYTLATALTQTLKGTSKGTPITLDAVVDGSQCRTIAGTRICNDPSDARYSSSSVTVANAMKYSLNTTFDAMAEQVGPDAVAATAHAAGISTTIAGAPSLADADGHTSFGIGIGDYPVHPIDQAVGFATFADGGVSHPEHFVQRVTASDGALVYQDKAHGTRAVDPKVANDVTLALEPVASFSGVGLAGGRPSAAKTGTVGIQTGRDAGGNSDAWMVGYTPQVSAAVWVGSGDSTHAVVNADGGAEYGRDLPGRTWQLFMDTYLQGQRVQQLASHQEVYPNGRTPSSSPPSTTSTAPVVPTTTAPTTTPPSTTSSAPSTPATTSAPPSPSTHAPSSAPPTTTAPPSPSRPPTPSGTCAPGLLGTCASPSSASGSPSPTR